jgi:hypothetical protein
LGRLRVRGRPDLLDDCPEFRPHGDIAEMGLARRPDAFSGRFQMCQKRTSLL